MSSKGGGYLLKEDKLMELNNIIFEVIDDCGWPNVSEISRRTSFDRKTVRKYLQQNCLPTEKKQRTKRIDTKLEEFKPYINQRLMEWPKLKGTRLFEEIVHKGYTGKLTILRDYLREIRPSLIKVSSDAILRYETEPGKVAQIDWGSIGSVEIDGKRKMVYAFAMILGYSRMRYAKLTLSQDTATLIQCIQNGFEYFGGIPKELLFDNMKSVVINRGDTLETREYNTMFHDFSKHYGFTIRLCKPFQPQTKGKVERLVSFIKSGFAYGRVFASLDEANMALLEWLARVNREVHGTTHKIPFEELTVEQPKLKDISSFPRFNVAHIESRKVCADSYLSYNGNMYSVPVDYARKQVNLRIYESSFDVIYNNELICNHSIVPGNGRRIRNPEHFKGLLAMAMERNNESITRKKTQRTQPPFIQLPSQVEVEQRSLDEYEKYSFAGSEK